MYSLALSIRRLRHATSGTAFLLVIAFAFVEAQRQLANTPQKENAPTRGNLVVAASGARDQTIRFGDELVVLVTLQNQGKSAIKIPAEALVLKNDGFTAYWGGGSGLGESTLVRPGAFDKQEITLEPEQSVDLIGSMAEMAVASMGPVEAAFSIYSENEAVRRDLGSGAQFNVSYYIAPSKLMTSVWSANTAEARQALLPQFRELLLLGLKKDETPRSRSYVDNMWRYLGCQTVPLLDLAMKDSDPVVREQSVRASLYTAASAANLNVFIDYLLNNRKGQAWTGLVGHCDERRTLEDSLRLTIAALNDQTPIVRTAAISVLTHRATIESGLRRSLANYRDSRESIDERSKQMYNSIGLIDPALPLVKKLATDSDPGVRSEAQKFLSNFASEQSIASDVIASLGDADEKVRKEALKALKASHEPPPMESIKQGFAATKGDVALGLIELIYEREDSDLAARLTPGFKERSAAERLMILTAIAGHSDDAALNLVGLGLRDGDTAIKRAALLRLLMFPTEKAISLLKATSGTVASDSVSVAVEKELRDRSLFPFLSGVSSASENIFPSVQGTGPNVSPDGKWVAYTETGWGRPGGSGGLGSSNLLSITHIVRTDGSLDRILSDMFLVGWMADSRRVASARSGFATIVDLSGKPVVEFGTTLQKSTTGVSTHFGSWPNGEIREQFGASMPHSKSLRSDYDRNSLVAFDFGEDAAFSPDGKWFGPRLVKDQFQFVDSAGNKTELKSPDPDLWGYQAVWSPAGAYVLLVPVHPGNSFGGDEGIKPGKALVIDFASQTLATTIDVDLIGDMGGWSYRKGRWNPWSSDGKRLTFVRRGQIWTSDANGNATQVTFDASNKIFPRFSPDGSKIAYITWQADDREHYTRLGPTDIWVVDVSSGLAARVTRPDPGRIEGVDWLDNGTLIFDRLEPDQRHSTLRTVSLR